MAAPSAIGLAARGFQGAAIGRTPGDALASPFIDAEMGDAHVGATTASRVGVVGAARMAVAFSPDLGAFRGVGMGDPLFGGVLAMDGDHTRDVANVDAYDWAGLAASERSGYANGGVGHALDVLIAVRNDART